MIEAIKGMNESQLKRISSILQPKIVEEEGPTDEVTPSEVQAEENDKVEELYD